jgi:hypothetical protein
VVIYFSPNAYSADNLITGLGDSIFGPIEGGGGQITFLDMDNGDIVTYEYNNLQDYGAYWYMDLGPFASTNPINISAGFTTWDNGGNYCIYINSDL